MSEYIPGELAEHGQGYEEWYESRREEEMADLKIPEPKYNIGDRVDIKNGRFVQQDAIVVGYEYFNPEIGDKEIWGFDYHVVYQLSNGEWERESYSEEYLS